MDRKTLTIGQMLGKLSAAEDSLERKEAYEKLEEVIEGHSDEQFIRVCMDEAKKGNFSADIGKCLPPDMENEEIVFKSSVCGTVVANW